MTERGDPRAASGGAADDLGSPFADRGSRTLVIQTAFLGDVILTTPLLEVLAARHGPVDVVTTPGAAQLLETHPAVREVIRHDKHGRERGIGGILRLASRLRANGYARAYLPHRSWRTGLAARLAGIPERIGFADAPARSSYTTRVPVRGAHEVDRLLALADAPSGGRPSLGLTDADHGAAIAWLETAGVPERFAVLAPGSIWGTKRWGKYPALAGALDLFVVVLGGPEDRALGDAIVAAAPGRSATACGALPLRASAALLARAAVLVTNDSAPLHLAQATGTPTVALFGPTVPAFGFGPRGPSDRIEEVSGLACRPCSRHGPAVCPLGHHRCMTDLAVDRVATTVRHLLSTPA
jgi:heptosyltransferase II